MARDVLALYTCDLETDETIWTNIRRKEIIRQFLYCDKTMHSTQKVGAFWKDINNLEDRQHCYVCSITESMSHILVDCHVTPIQIIWDLAKHYWPSSRFQWPEISMRIILGCGSLTVQLSNTHQRNPNEPQRNNHTQGTSRLLCIIILESAHPIWVLHCKRIIQEHQHSENEIKVRWLHAINIRLTTSAKPDVAA